MVACRKTRLWKTVELDSSDYASNTEMVVGAFRLEFGIWKLLEFGAGNDVTIKLTMFQIQKRRGFFCESFRLGTWKNQRMTEFPGMTEMVCSSLSLISMCL